MKSLWKVINRGENKMKKRGLLNGVFWLILVYLFATRGGQINTLIKTLGNFTLKSVALLQGRDDVEGVTG